jgi:hypothetical protein
MGPRISFQLKRGEINIKLAGFDAKNVLPTFGGRGAKLNEEAV